MSATKLRYEMINYYSDLIYRIDIETENMLLSIDESEKQILNSIRQNMVLKIKEVEKFNLNNLTVGSKSSFESKFCFFLSRKLKKKFLRSEKNRFGILIIVNHYIDNKIVNYLE